MEKDNLRSWLVLNAVTFAMFLEVGIIKAFSVLLPEIKDQLATYTWIVGSCISVIYGWGYILGLLAAPLAKKFGPRLCIMMSGLIFSVGLIVCACATNVHIFLLGIFLVGFVLLLENVCVGVVPEYFDKHYNTAVSFFGFGTAIAILIMPILTQMLLDVYGWRGAVLLLSGLGLHSIPCGALLKPSPVQEMVTEEIVLIPDTNKIPDESDKNTFFFKQLKSICKLFRAPFLTNLQVIARVLVPSCVNGFVFSGWLIYIVTFAVSNGLTIKQSSYVSTCGGLGIALIRIALPFLHKWMTYQHLLYASSFIAAISLVLTTVFDSVVGMCTTSCIYGASMATQVTEIYIAAKHIVDEAEYACAISWAHLYAGISTILSGTLTGLIYDRTGSFTVSFTILAAVSLLTIVSLGLEDIWSRFKESKLL